MKIPTGGNAALPDESANTLFGVPITGEIPEPTVTVRIEEGANNQRIMPPED